KKQPEVQQQDVVIDKVDVQQPEVASTMSKKQPEFQNNISIYPNPVTDGLVKLSFTDQQPGKYQIQLIDISGRVIGKKEVTINNKVQVEEYRLPELIAKGNYMFKITSYASN